MKYLAKPVLIALVTLLLGGFTAAHAVEPAEYAKTFTPQQLQQDIDFVSAVITEVHPAFHDNPARAGSFGNELKALGSSLDHPLTRGEFFSVLAPLVAKLEDGHTVLHAPLGIYADYAYEGASLFPLDLVFVEGGTFVYRDPSAHEALPAGTPLVSIDDVPIDEFVAKVSNRLSGTPQWRLQQLAGKNDRLKGMFLMEYGSHPLFDIGYLSDGQVKHVQTKGVVKERRNKGKSAAAAADVIGFRMLENGAGLLTVKGFETTSDDFKKVLKDAFKQLRKTGADNLVIDVRDNTGGTMDLVAEVLSYLSAEPFPLTKNVTVRTSEPFKDRMKQRIPSLVRWRPVQYLDARGREIWSSEEGSLVTVPPTEVKPKSARSRFDGNTYVLTNAGTFSAAAIFAAAFQREKLGVTVGHESGGESGIFFAQPLTLELPNSGLSLNVASMTFDMGTEGAVGANGGVKPDIAVEASVECALGARDCVMDRALQLIEANPTIDH